MPWKSAKRSLKNEAKPERVPVVFSFKYLDRIDADFPITSCLEVWLRDLLERMECFSTMSRTELQSPGSSKTLRSHGIDWKDTTRASFGIPNEEDIVDRPWQLGISTANGRIHGFFINDTFYLRWLDPDHKLYS